MRFPRDRGRLVAVLTSLACVVAVVVGATAATSTLAPAVAFAQTGHWVVNAAESKVVHVDGGTRQVDAQVELPSDVGDPLFALQGDTQGFVVGADRIAVFGRSTLTVDSTIPVEFAEVPVGIETLGGPYLVYREAGTIVRLGVPPLSLPVGGRLDRPVWTDDGTVWVHRPDNGSFCAVRDGADALDCAATTAPGEPGALTVTAELPAFLATRPDAVEVIASGRLGAPVGVGADVPDEALVADRDTEGRLAVVEPATNRLVLTDSGGVPDGRAGGAAFIVDLGPGRFTSPIASRGVIAVLDESANRLLTFDPAGRRLGSVDLPPGAAPTLVRGGDGQIYVDDADGAATHVVGADGSVTSVGTGGVAPDLVAVAAPPGRSSGVVPPPPSGRPSPQVSRPVTGPRPGPSGPVPPQPLQPPPVVPQPLGSPSTPVGVVARLDAGGAVTIAWQPADGRGLPVTYVVSGGGKERTTATTSVEFLNLALGRPATFVVRATTSAGTSPPSAPSNPVTPVGTAEAPGGLTASPSVCGPVCEPIVVTWTAPDLKGGQLLHYLVTAARPGRALRSQEVGGTSATFSSPDDVHPCEPAEITVRAVTGGGGGAGVVASATTENYECAPEVGVVDVESTETTSATIQVLFTSYVGDIVIPAECSLSFDGAVLWTDPSCVQVVDYESIDAVVEGLAPGTSYSVVATVTNEYGSTDSPAAVVTTASDDSTCVLPDPQPPDCS